MSKMCACIFLVNTQKSLTDVDEVANARKDDKLPPEVFQDHSKVPNIDKPLKTEVCFPQ